jgi:D-glycero-D-manno-heptose 1,7-bisphosphate phosphatase
MGVGALTGAIFFDRDGVLNDAVVRDGKPYPPDSIEGVRLDPYARQAVADAHELDLRAIIVTNQPDVSRGLASVGAVNAINTYVLESSRADALYVCMHDDADNCACRKPKPGLLMEAAKERRLDLTASFLIGDRWKDIAAGRAAGCRTIFIDRGYSETAVDVRADVVVVSLEEAMRAVRSLLEAHHA